MASLAGFLRSFCALTLALVPAGAATLPAQAQLGPATVDNQDPAMKAAVLKARRTLPQFWRMIKRPPEGVSNFALKVAIRSPTETFVEHFWLVALKPEKNRQISGRINNQPKYVTSVRFGQRYTFDRQAISDWMYIQNGKIVGNWTLRPLLNRMPKTKAKQYRRLLALP